MGRPAVLVVGLVLVVGSGACGTTGAAPKPAAGSRITIGSLDSPGQVIVAHLYADVLEHAGAAVTLRTNSDVGLGTRASVEAALASGRLDLYPDVAGALLLFLDPNDTGAATRVGPAVAAIKRALEGSGATALEPAPALDTRVFAVTRATAAEDHLTTLSSLQSVSSKLVVGGPSSCPSQAQCLGGLQSTYGLHFKSFTSLDDAGPITVSALNGGEVQVAELWSSDGTLLGNDFVALRDDKHLLNADYVTPVIRTSVDTRRVAGALDRLSARLTTEQLSQLSLEVIVDHVAPGAVARRWLERRHLI